jgi:hypothetical protein
MPKNVQYGVLFVSDTCLVWFVCCGDVYGLFVLAYLCRYYLSALDSNDTESIEEGKVFEYQEEEDQGQATQGKPSTWCISESYCYTMHCLLLLSYLCIVSYIAIDL